MAKTTSEKLLDALGVAILQITRTGRDHFYLYAEVEPGVVSPSFFQVIGDDLVYTDPSGEMVDAIHDLWHESADDERWRALRFEMIGGWSKAEFDVAVEPGRPELPFYGDGEDDYNPNDVEEADRRMLAALRARFGEGATIVYPTTTRRPLQPSFDFSDTERLGPA